MIAFKVSVNGNPLCLAGAKDLGVLNAIVSASGKLGPETEKMRDGAADLSLRVGGLTSRGDSTDEHLKWVEFFDLQVGDEITVQVVESEVSDPPESSRVKDEERASDKRREEWEYAKEYYLTFREEFESET